MNGFIQHNLQPLAICPPCQAGHSFLHSGVDFSLSTWCGHREAPLCLLHSPSTPRQTIQCNAALPSSSAKNWVSPASAKAPGGRKKRGALFHYSACSTYQLSLPEPVPRYTGCYGTALPSSYGSEGTQHPLIVGTQSGCLPHPTLLVLLFLQMGEYRG